MPDATRRKAETPCSPQQTLRLRLKALTRDGLSVNPAKIDGGSPNNVVPDHAVLRVNLRPHSPRLQDIAYNEIKRLVSIIEQEHEVSIHLHGHFNRPPKPLTPDAEKLFGLVKQLRRGFGPFHRLEVNRRGLRRQQYRGLRRSRCRHDGCSRRQYS
jgi:glutamate carboxypeptidase